MCTPGRCGARAGERRPLQLGWGFFRLARAAKFLGSLQARQCAQAGRQGHWPTGTRGLRSVAHGTSWHGPGAIIHNRGTTHTAPEWRAFWLAQVAHCWERVSFGLLAATETAERPLLESQCQRMAEKKNITPEVT